MPKFIGEGGKLHKALHKVKVELAFILATIAATLFSIASTLQHVAYVLVTSLAALRN